MSGGPKTFKGKSVSKFRQPREQLNRQSDSSNERDNLLFFQGDDEKVILFLMKVRTIVKPQIHVAASEH
jgi:hypothetical protein